MIPDAFAPVTCQTCGAEKSHDVRHGKSLALPGRVFKCGASVTVWADGVVNDALICPRSTEIIAALRADNVRLGDRNVLLATELQAIHETAHQSLELGQTPYWMKRTLATICDLAVEALADVPAAAPGAAETVTVGAVLGSEATAEHVGERS